VIGGKSLYEESAAHENCDSVYLTRIGRKFDADVFLNKNIFKEYKVAKTSATMSENDTNFDFQLLYKGE
jgi:dihydrofolate reductase